MNIGFTKMHGTGNDFIVIDNFNGKIKLTDEQVVFLCDRHKGVGADGIILVETFSEKKSEEENIKEIKEEKNNIKEEKEREVEKEEKFTDSSNENLNKTKNAETEKADCFMNYINADGSLAKMCGNGIRCTAKFLKDFYLKDKTIFKIATRDGIKEIICNEDGEFSVNMGKPVFESDDYANGERKISNLDLDFVSVGNPFAISFVEGIEGYDLKTIGPLVENHKSFPNKINFEVVEIKNKNEITVKTWERGCGAVLACGTGASSAFALFNKTKNGGDAVLAHLPGGDLFLTFNKMGEIIMKGPAVSVFSSMIEL